MAQSQSNTLSSKKTPTTILGGTSVSPAMKQVASQYQINSVTGKMEPKQASLAFPALTAVGGTPKSTSSLLGANQPTKNPASGQSTRTDTNLGSLSSRDQQIANLESQARTLKTLVDQKAASEAASKNTKKNQPPITGNTKGLFSSVLGSLVNVSGDTKEQDRVRKLMEKTAAGNKAIADEAKRVSDQYGAEIARVGQLGAGAVAGNLSTGTNVVGSGNAAIASQSASQRMNALAEAQQAALKGTEQQLKGQQQTADALNPSLAAALTQQQQQIQGLGTVGGLASPTQVQPGSTLFTPDTGQEVAAGMGGWANYTTAQQAQSLMEQYPDTGIQYNPSLSPQQNLQMIQGAIGGSPTYQRGTYGVAGAGSYIGAQQLGAAGTLTGQVAQLQTQGAAADANFNVMLSILQRGGINDLNQPILNQLIQNISRGVSSDADVVAFRSALQTVRAQYAAILGGGTPTDATQAMAAEKIPDTVSASALQEVERTMKTMVQNTVAAYNQQIGSYSQGGSFGGGGNPFAEQW